MVRKYLTVLIENVQSFQRMCLDLLLTNNLRKSGVLSARTLPHKLLSYYAQFGGVQGAHRKSAQSASP
jgi:hypothetical protein